MIIGKKKVIKYENFCKIAKVKLKGELGLTQIVLNKVNVMTT